MYIHEYTVSTPGQMWAVRGRRDSDERLLRWDENTARLFAWVAIVTATLVPD